MKFLLKPVRASQSWALSRKRAESGSPSFRSTRRRLFFPVRAGTAVLFVLLLATFSSTGFVTRAQGPSASRQGESVQKLSLADAAAAALRNNPVFRATGAGRSMADARLSEARSRRLPVVRFNETFTNSNNPIFVFGSLLEQGRFIEKNFALPSLNNPASLNNFRTALSFELPIFDQLQSDTRIKRARIERRQADAQQLRVEQQIRFEVIRAFYATVVAFARKEVADEAVRMAEGDVKRVRDLFETGMVVHSDLLSAEVQLSEFKQQQIEAEGEIAIARAALNTVMGTPVTEIPAIDAEMRPKSFAVPDQAELLRLALKDRPDYQQATLNERSAEQATRESRGQYLPRLDLFASYGGSGRGLGSGSADYSVGASLTWTLFDHGRNARAKESSAAQALASAEAEQKASAIRLEVIAAARHFGAARQRVSVASQAGDQAAETLRIVQERYRAGLTTMTEVLRAETAMVRARLNLLNARHDEYVGYGSVLLSIGGLNDVRAFEQ